jgi:hypothetical protein
MGERMIEANGVELHVEPFGDRADGEQPREPLSPIPSPTLVIHGTADPMFPIGHGTAFTGASQTARRRSQHT